MKVVVEIISAEYGGIRTYVEHLLRTWELTRPEDELLVVVPESSTVPTFGHERVELRVPRPDTLFRPVVQTLRTPRIAREFGADAVLATLPSTTLLKPSIPTAIVIYDLRHELRPEQFTRGRRLLRGVSYSRGYQVTDGILSISQRSLDDLHELHPRTRRVPAAVTHLGADHVLTWPGPVGGGPAITAKRRRRAVSAAWRWRSSGAPNRRARPALRRASSTSAGGRSRSARKSAATWRSSRQ